MTRHARQRRASVNHTVVATLAVLVASLLFGTTGTAQELGPDDTTPLGIGAVRIAVGALGLIVIASRTTRVARESWRRAAPGLLLAGVGVAGYQVGFFVGVERAGVALGTLVALGSGPVIAGVVTGLTSRRWPSPVWLCATVLAIAGVGLVAAGSESNGGRDAVGVGVLAALLAGASYALLSFASKRAMVAGVPALRAMAASFSIGAMMLSPLLIVEPMQWLTTGRGAAVALHLGLVVTSIGYALFGAGLARLPVATVVSLTLVEPATAAVLGVFAVDQPLSALGWGGVACVLAGVAGVTLFGTGVVEAQHDPSADTVAA